MEAISRANPNLVISPSNNAYGRVAKNNKIKTNEQRVEQTTIRNVIENGKVIVEQYDRHGKLIRKTPPGYLPLGENI
jgi:hypothetical protein